MSKYNTDPLSYYEETAGQDDMPTAERELAEDAQWKLIQKNTFTRWCNEHLKTVNKNVSDLEFDLSDGLRLLALVEVLAGHKFPRVNKRPNFRTQKLENVTMVMKFLEIDEGIKIVNIDSSDIVDHKLKLILGLIWALIRHYFISMPQWSDEPKEADKDVTPKQRLLQWVGGKMPPERPVKNFTTDWNDGTAIGALVDSVAPGLCPDWPDWNPKENVRNATEAMDAAENWLDVPQLIQPKEMCNPKVDEMSMMTYLSQFPNAKLKEGAPLRPRADPNRVRAYGKGLEPSGNCVGGAAPFTVETFSAGSGRLEIVLLNPKGQQETCECRFNDDKNKTYTCSYTPTTEGEYRLIIKYNGTEIPKSPFRVKVEGAAGDSSKVTCDGPGIQSSGPQAGKPTWFKVYTEDAFPADIELPEGAGSGQVDVWVQDPAGRRDSVRTRLTPESSVVTLAEYAAQRDGLHSVNVQFGGKAVPGSPFSVNISPGVNAKHCYARGRGIQARGVRVDDRAVFKVFTPKSAGPGKLDVRVQGPGDSAIPVRSKPLDAECTEYVYEPKQTGPHVVDVQFSGEQIQKAPFKINVGPFKVSRIRAFGPGLEGGQVGSSADFTVETNGEAGALGFAIEGPSQARIDCKDRGDASADVSYWPTQAGEYAVHILCNDEDIPQSPFMAEVFPASQDFDASKVRCSGPGLERTGNQMGELATFDIDTTKAGNAPLRVSCHDASYSPVDVKVTEKAPGTYSCQYRPGSSTKHTVSVVFGGLAVPGSPFRIYVSEPTRPDKVRVYGPGVESGVTSREKTHFTVDCKEAGPGKVAIALFDDAGNDVPVKCVDNKDGTFRVEYEPKSAGTFTVSVLYAEIEIPDSPIRVRVHPAVDVSKVRVQDMEPNVFLDAAAEFTVDARPVSATGEGEVRAVISSPSGSKQEATVKNNEDGTYKVIYAPYETGPHDIDVTYDTLPIPGAPFQVTAIEGCDPSKVTAYGPGLDAGLTGKTREFTVCTRGAGPGALALGVEGPAKVTLHCTDNKDGTCTAEYQPTTAGDYDINIKFDDQHIPGSPFPVRIRAPLDASKVHVSGDGVNPEAVRSGRPVTFRVDPQEAGDGKLEAVITDASGRRQSCAQHVRPDGSIDCTYTPTEEGPVSVDVAYGGQAVPHSPFQVNAKASVDPDQVRVSGQPLKHGAPASIPTALLVDARDAGQAPLQVNIQDPNGARVPVQIEETVPGRYQAHFTPWVPGPHTADVLYGGQPVSGAPFSLEVSPSGDASKARILGGNQNYIHVNKENVVDVDYSKAGQGQVSCQVLSASGSEVEVEVDDHKDGSCSLIYTPSMLGEHAIRVEFGGSLIPDGDFKQQVVNVQEEMMQQQVQATEAMHPPMYNPDQLAPVEFKFKVGPVFNFVTAEVKTPNGDMDFPGVEDNDDGTVTLRYQPSQTGLHELRLCYNGEPVQGSPFLFHVDQLDCGYVTAHGPGLTHGTVTQPAEFVIVTKDAGAGGLSLAVEGPSKAEIDCEDRGDGTCAVSYLPSLPGEYNVNVRYNDQHIRGSPFTAKITEPDRSTSAPTVGSSNELSLGGIDEDVRSLRASIVSPSGQKEPCELKTLPNGHLGISFTPKEVGQHEVNVTRHGRHIDNSPFKIYVGESEVGNASKVRCYGAGLKEGVTGVQNNFTVDTKEAGFGSLSLSIEGPSKADIECNDQSDGKVVVTYTPLEAGTYLVNVKFSDQHVPGSPFSLRVHDATNGAPQTERIVREREQVSESGIGSQCELSLKIPDTAALDMTASVTNPSGVTNQCDIRDLGDCHYGVTFVPTEIGVHTVSVKNRGLHIPGSPFQFTVGPLAEGGAHKCRAGGPGLQRAEVNEPADFDVYTREAGAGGLSIAVEGPSKADIRFDDRKDGTCGVTYVIDEAGEYYVSIKFNDEHIPDSPFRVDVCPEGSEAKRLTVGALQERGLQTGKPAAFTVNFNGAEGHLTARVISPSGTEDEALVQEIDTDSKGIGSYAVRFIPRENGIHFVHVRFDGVEIPGSPFRLLVGASQADPGLVTASGDGLERGVTGEVSEFVLNTTKAGSGALSVAVEGPSKVQLECREVAEGYGFSYTPQAPGDYFVNVRYGGPTHIPGSPFKAKVTGIGRASSVTEQSQLVVDTVQKTRILHASKLRAEGANPSQVQVKGKGLNKAFIGQKNQFNVDCSQAGRAILLVGVYGPGDDAVCEEVTVRHMGYKQYAVNYAVKERGEYIIVVKWGDEHIAGSPFVVQAF